MADHGEPGVAASGGESREDRASRRERLDRYLADRDASAGLGTDGRIEPGQRSTKHPLAPGQEQIWLHSQLISDPSAYNEPLTLTHRGTLDVEVLRRTLGEIVRRHEALRTNFTEVNGQPIAIVRDPAEVDLRVVDLSHFGPGERGSEVNRIATEELRRPFDLEVGPLLRFVLFKLEDDFHRLDAAVHQIIFDGVSIYSGFLPELTVIYEDFLRGRASSLQDPPIQYQDFVRWQRATTPDKLIADQLAYWRETLGELQPGMSLPTDRPRPPVQSYAGEHFTFSIPETLSVELRAFSQREGVTLFVTLLTAFAVLLARRTGEEIQTIGSVTSIRKRPELERLIGFFLNTVALRVDLTGDPPFREALRRARNVVIDGLTNGDVPIHQVLQALSLPRDSSRSPLFQTILILEPPLPEGPIDWESSTQAVDVGRSRVDLHLQLENRPDAIVGRIRYPTALFDRTTVEALVRQWLTLIQAAVAEPDRSIGDLPMLTDGERSALLSAGHRVAPTKPFERFTPDQLEQSIAARFAGEVAAFGDRPAVIEANRHWTYRELDTAADAVAEAIVASCPKVRARVGLLGQPDGRLVAAILGILKSGGAYVPLDAQFPAKRIRSIALDAELDLIVVDEGLRGLTREALGEEIGLVDMAVASIAPTADQMDRAEPGDPGYMLYTSGSTGEPKGTVQSQRNVLHHIRAYTNALHIGPDDRILLVAKPTFDASVMDMFGALLNGAALCVVDLNAVGFIGLGEVIANQRVTIYHSTPTVFRELVSALGPAERLASVRAVVLGGEEARTADFHAFRQHFNESAIFVNGLGPTESTLGLQFLADATSTINRASIPAGYPVEATDVFLMDPYGRPSDFVGEIAIRSRYVALGYWNRPELTAAAFSHDATDPDLVTYRTGDMGRRLADGSIEFAGRRDRQAKVRGMRVDAAEIERALSALAGVGQVAVEIRPIDGETQLVAYIEGSPASGPSQHDIRASLREVLPEYMIPSAIVWLDRLPLTSSNKLDRLAMPTPSREAHTASVASARDDLEQRLVRIWEEVLSRRPIGIDEDFFDLGGHSLLAARLFDQIWRETGERIPLSALLEGATIERLAGRIREGQDPGRSGLIAVQPAGTHLPLFVVPGVGSRVLYLRNLAVNLGQDQPLYALHQPPSGPTGHADRRIEDLAGHYVAAIRRVQRKGPYHLVGYSFGGAVAYEIAQQLTAAGETVALLALIDSRNPAQRLPPPGLQLRFVGRRIVNQARIIRRLGIPVGAAYLRQRMRIAINHSLVALREALGRRLPARVQPWLWPDPAPLGEREWLAADGAAFARYQPAPYPGRITFLWAQHNQRPPEVFDTRRGWAELALGGLDVRPIPGSHLTVLVEPLVGITAAAILDLLGEVQNGSEPGGLGERSLASGGSRTEAPQLLS